MPKDNSKTESSEKLLPDIVKMPRPEKEYMNISKVAHYISGNTGLLDNETSLRLKTIPKKNIFVAVDLHKDEHLQSKRHTVRHGRPGCRLYAVRQPAKHILTGNAAAHNEWQF